VKFIKNITSSSLVVQWNAVSDISDIYYAVTWRSGGGFIITRMTSYTITGLTVDTTYTINVSAIYRCGYGPVFTTSILFSPDTTSTTTIISPTITTSTNPMTIVSTVIPSSSSSSSSITTTTYITPHIITSNSISTMASKNPDVTGTASSATTILMSSTTTTMNPGTTVTSIIVPTTPTTTPVDVTSKFSGLAKCDIYVIMKLVGIVPQYHKVVGIN